MSLKVALTGGIACGKSVITEAFLKLQVKVIDTDLISRQLVAPGSPLLTELCELFGRDMLTAAGSLNRQKMRELVFGQPSELARLNALLHPAILTEVQTELLSYQAEPYVVIAVPLLFELNWQNRFDRILVADCAREVQLKRLQERDHISEELALRMLAEQVSQERRRELAQDLIETDKLSLKEIGNYVLKLDAVYRQLAKDY